MFKTFNKNFYIMAFDNCVLLWLSMNIYEIPPPNLSHVKAHVGCGMQQRRLCSGCRSVCYSQFVIFILHTVIIIKDCLTSPTPPDMKTRLTNLTKLGCLYMYSTTIHLLCTIMQVLRPQKPKTYIKDYIETLQIRGLQLSQTTRSNE